MVRRRLIRLAVLLLVAWAAWRFVAQGWAVIAQHRTADERPADSAAKDGRADTPSLGSLAQSPTQADENARPPEIGTAGPAADAAALEEAVGPLSPEVWRFDSRAVRILRRCVHQVELSTPPGATIAFAAPPFDDSAFAFAWVEYLLPERRFVLRSDLADWRDVEWLLSYGAPLTDGRWGSGQRLFCGWLYRAERHGAVP